MKRSLVLLFGLLTLPCFASDDSSTAADPQAEVEKRVNTYANRLRHDMIHSLNEQMKTGTEQKIQQLIGSAISENVKGDETTKAVLATIVKATIAPKVQHVVIQNLNQAMRGMAEEDFKGNVNEIFAKFLRAKISLVSDDPKLQLEQLLAIEDKLPDITKDLGKLAQENMVNSVVHGFVNEAIVQGVDALIEGKSSNDLWVGIVKTAFTKSLDRSLGNSALSSLFPKGESNGAPSAPSYENESAPARSLSSTSAPRPELPAAKPVILLNENWAVKAKMLQARSFHLNEPHKVKFMVFGLKDTAKGFKVQVSPVEAGGGPAVISTSKDLDLAAGDYTISVTNSENLLKVMTVHVTLILDPK